MFNQINAINFVLPINIFMFNEVLIYKKKRKQNKTKSILKTKAKYLQLTIDFKFAQA